MKLTIKSSSACRQPTLIRWFTQKNSTCQSHLRHRRSTVCLGGARLICTQVIIRSDSIGRVAGGWLSQRIMTQVQKRRALPRPSQRRWWLVHAGVQGRPRAHRRRTPRTMSAMPPWKATHSARAKHIVQGSRSREKESTDLVSEAAIAMTVEATHRAIVVEFIFFRTSTESHQKRVKSSQHARIASFS